MMVHSVWWKSLAAVCCWSGVVCLAEDGSTDLINDVDAPIVVEVNAAPPAEAQRAELVVDEQAQPGATGGTLNVTPPASTESADVQARLQRARLHGELLKEYVGAVGAGEAEPGKYWIGLLCVDPGEALRAQLGLGEGVGLLVEAVTENSPAKKAGVLPHDVLVTANLTGDKVNETVRVLKQVQELVAVVQASEAKRMHLELIRKGQRQVIEITPAERPQPKAGGGPQPSEFNVIFDDAVSPKRNISNWKGQHPLGLRLAGPMFVVAEQRPALPEGTTMEFFQVVGQPEKITVKKGDQTWELMETTLDKVPEEVRVVVLQQLAARRAGTLSQVITMPPMGEFLHSVISLPPNHQGPTPIALDYDNAKSEDVKLYDYDLTRATPLVVTATSVSLPDDVAVTIVRKGSDPAKITVKKGEQTWDVTEKELDKLPEDLRKHADSALRGQARQTLKTMPVLGVDLTPKISSIAIQPLIAQRYQVAVDELQRRAAAAEQVKKQMEQQREQLEKLEQHEIREQLKKLNDKIEKLQQALEKSAPKQ